MREVLVHIGDEPQNLAQLRLTLLLHEAQLGAFGVADQLRSASDFVMLLVRQLDQLGFLVDYQSGGFEQRGHGLIQELKRPGAGARPTVTSE
ncbi:MAG: hypothetical protein ACRDK3_14915 [Actinomycetota bacterium]